MFKHCGIIVTNRKGKKKNWCISIYPKCHRQAIVCGCPAEPELHRVFTSFIGKTTNQLGYTGTVIQEWRHSMIANQLPSRLLHHILWVATSTSLVTRASPWKMPRSPYSPSNRKIEGWNSRASLCDPGHLLQHLFWMPLLMTVSLSPSGGDSDLGGGTAP